MDKKELKVLIEEIVTQELCEQNIPKRKLAIRYAKAIKRRDPELYNILYRQALFAIRSIKQDEKPRDATDDTNKLLKMEPEGDLRKSADSHGVKLFIDAIVKDPELAGKSKRFWQQALDALLRDTYQK
jgi:hypothetical protein